LLSIRFLFSKVEKVYVEKLPLLTGAKIGIISAMKILSRQTYSFNFFAPFPGEFAVFSAAQENAGSDKNIFLDSDQDGLSDEEERMLGTDPFNPDTDGDGYSDGVEVRSGYDPLKPAPGDKIIKDSGSQLEIGAQLEEEENLTEQLSLQVANLITNDSQDQEGITLETLIP
jgi:hypothetical protein